MTEESFIAVLRRSIGFGPAEEALVRAAAARLSAEVEGWVEGFYARLVVDPVAMGILRDESRVVRLKRSLAAWFHELFSLPVDEGYERARRDIGRAHVRVGMPQYLMVTAMGGVRRDVARSVARLWAEDPGHAERLAAALGKVLDLELALMLEAYRRRQRELDQERSASFLEMRVAARLADHFGESLDAARCYLELVRTAAGGEREAWAARLEDVLRGCLADPAARRDGAEGAPRTQPADARDVCARAAGNVSLATSSGLEISIEPPHLEVSADPERLQRALEVMLQGVANLGAGSVGLRVRGTPRDASFEVLLQDGSWPEGVTTLEDLGPEGVDVGFLSHVVGAHGGTVDLARDGEGRARGVRFTLPFRPDGPTRAHLAADSQRTPA